MDKWYNKDLFEQDDDGIWKKKFQVGKNLIIDVSNFNKITGIKTPAIIIDCDQIAYSAGVTILVRIGKRKKLTRRSANLADA